MIEAIRNLPRSVCNFLLFIAGVIVWQGVVTFMNHTEQEYRELGNNIGNAMCQIERTNSETAQSLSAIHKDITSLQIDLTKLRASILTPEQVKLLIKAEVGKYHSLTKD